MCVRTCVRCFCVHLHSCFFWICMGFFLHRSPVHFTFQLNLNYGKKVLWHFRLKIVLPARKITNNSLSKKNPQTYKQTTKQLLKCIVIKMIWLKISNGVYLKVYINKIHWYLMQGYRILILITFFFCVFQTVAT